MLCKRCYLLWSFYSLLEGAMKLTFCLSAPLEICFCLVLVFAKVKNFQFLAENHGL